MFETFKDPSRYLRKTSFLKRKKLDERISIRIKKIPTIPTNLKFQIEFYFQSEQIKASESQRALKALRVQSN